MGHHFQLFFGPGAEIVQMLGLSLRIVVGASSVNDIIHSIGVGVIKRSNQVGVAFNQQLSQGFWEVILQSQVMIVIGCYVLGIMKMALQRAYQE